LETPLLSAHGAYGAKEKAKACVTWCPITIEVLLTFIAYTDIGFARSTDAGRTWFWQTVRPLRNTTYELAFDPDAQRE
jgi:hypothetical protein